MRRAFTLIEMMVVVAIIGLVLTMGISSISAGKRAARVKGAARDVHAAVRHARSVALVTGQRVLVNFSNVTVDDEVMAKVEVVSAKIISSDANRPEPQPYYVMEYKELAQKAKAGEKYELVHIRKSGEKEGAKAESPGEGETIEEYLFSPMSEDAVLGMRILVKKGDEELSEETDVQTRSRISVFSNVDYLQNRYKEAKKEAESKSPGGSGKDSASPLASGSSGSVNDMDETVSVVWETNGAVEPHRIWIYPDGGKPEDGLLLDVDRFGAIKVLNGDGKEDD